jgi:hypothetical protein
MCYSAEVSIGTFVAVSAASLYLWMRNKGIDRGIALVLFIVSLMQLFEFILWINPECNDANKWISAIIPVYLYLQPALLAFAVWLTNSGTGAFYPLIIISALIGFIPYTLYVFRTRRSPCIFKGECGHLDWKMFDNLLKTRLEPLQYIPYIVYYSMMAYVIYTLKNKMFANIFLLFGGLSLLITNMTYSEVWGSVWCHSVNAMAIAAILV